MKYRQKKMGGGEERMNRKEKAKRIGGGGRKIKCEKMPNISFNIKSGGWRWER